MDFFEVGWGINFEPAWASVALGLGTFNPNAKYTALFKIDVTFSIMLKKYNREKHKHETTLSFFINEERYIYDIKYENRHEYRKDEYNEYVSGNFSIVYVQQWKIFDFRLKIFPIRSVVTTVKEQKR